VKLEQAMKLQGEGVSFWVSFIVGVLPGILDELD
jgi:hypothetical protein